MLQTSIPQVTTQVKPRITRQEALEQRLTHAIANRQTTKPIEVDGSKFTILYKHGACGNRNYYIIRTTVNKSQEVPVGGEKQAQFLRSLGKPVKMEVKSFIKPIESGAVLEVELGISSTMASKVVAVAGWSNVVEAFVAQVCQELGWQYVSPRKREFNARVALLHGDQSYID